MLKSLVLALLLVLVSAGIASAQDKAVVQGYAYMDINRDGGWQPGEPFVAMAWVELVSLNEKPARLTNTDEYGHYNFDYVGVGTYMIFSYTEKVNSPLRTIDIGEDTVVFHIDLGLFPDRYYAYLPLVGR